jgi:filamentous hemagglutinin family protein
MQEQIKKIVRVLSDKADWRRLKPLAFVVVGIFCAPSQAQTPARTQIPAGGVVTAGQANISQSGSVTTINQATNRAAIKWNSFDLGQDASINFVQPDSKSVTLNRIAGNNPSQIFGQIRANGQVYLMNPEGIYFSPSAGVNVGGIVATTHQMTDAEFMQGKTTFSRSGAKGRVVNDGKIEADLGGYVALLAPEVRNRGFILASQGTVAMAGGESITLNFGPLNKLDSLTVSAGDMSALIENQHAVQAPNGLVIMSARAINELASRVVNTGVIEAKGFSDKSGRIILDAGPTGTATVSGTVDVSTDSGRGGRVVVTGDQVQVLSGARINASGASGGGEILVGGGWQGQDQSIPQATTTTIQSGAVLQANATREGDGGTVVAWSDIKKANSLTTVNGRLEATGGPNGGNGGKIETSGHQVDLVGAGITAAALRGRGGLWLIDPYDYVIGSAQALTIVNSLDSGTDVTVDTSVNNAGYGSNGNISSVGNISITSAIGKTTGPEATLTLNAANNIFISADISSLGNKLNLVLNSGGSSGLVSGVLALAQGALTKQGVGTIKLTADNTYRGLTTISAGSLIIENNAPSFLTSGFTGAGTLTIQPASTSFSSAYTIPDAFSASSLGGLTIGKVGNTSSLTVQNAISIAGPITLYGGNVNFNANVSTSAGDMLVRSSGTTTISSGKALSTTNGNIVLTTSQFLNNSNAAALAVGGADKYWQVWSTNASPFAGGSADVTAGLSFDYVQYAATYGATLVAGSGKGLLYSYAPSIVVGLVSATSKVYDGNNTASLTSANYQVTTGPVNGDVLVSLSTPTTGTYASKNAGTLIPVTAAGVSLGSTTTSSQTGSKPVYGYTLAGGGSVSGNIGEITPANLTITANDLIQGFTGKPFVGGNGISVVGFVNGETIDVLSGKLAYGGTSQGAINPGAYTLLATGLTSQNYQIKYVGGMLGITEPVYGILSPAPSSVLISMLPSASTLVMPGVSDSSDSSGSTGSADTNSGGSGANAGGDANTQPGTGKGAGGPGDGSGPGNGAGQGIGQGSASGTSASGSGANAGGDANTQPGTGKGAGGPGDGSGPGNGAGQGIGQGSGSGPSALDVSPTSSSGSGANAGGDANTQPGTGKGAGGPGDGSGPGNGAGQGIGQGSGSGSSATEVSPVSPSGTGSSPVSEGNPQPGNDTGPSGIGGGSAPGNGPAQGTGQTSTGESTFTDPSPVSPPSADANPMRESGAQPGTDKGPNAPGGSSVVGGGSASGIGTEQGAGQGSGSSSSTTDTSASNPSSSGANTGGNVNLQSEVGQGVSGNNNSQRAVDVKLSKSPSGASKGVVVPERQRLVTYEDISVSLVREAVNQTKGLVTVLVPREIITSGKEFSFRLPEKIVNDARAPQSIRVTTVSGGPLPAWLKFDSSSQTLASESSGSRVFPLTLLISIENKKVDLVISERTNQ